MGLHIYHVSKMRAFIGVLGMMEFSLNIEAFAEASKPKTNVVESSSSDRSSFQRVFDDILVDYQNEIEVGCSIYDNPLYSSKEETPTPLSLKDNDFIERRVGTGLGGPDEAIFKVGDAIYQTRNPILTTEECNDLVSEARQIIQKGLASEQAESTDSRTTNSQLGEARVSGMPKAREWLRHSLHDRFFPLLESRFGISKDDFTLQDALVIGYGCLSDGGARSQPIHRDSSLISLNVALSPQTDYEDGGTFFEALPHESSVVYNERGNILCHSGGILHAGRGIASGERWVLVLFCIAKDRPEFARRCHKRGIERMDEGQLAEAKAIFEAGLSLAPNDHLLLTSLGAVFNAEGNQEDAMMCLKRAADAYPHCQKANLALGKMLLASGRPFAAIQHFDAVLDWMKDRDLDEHTLPQLRAIGFDARVVGSQAALFCAQQAKEQNFDDFPWQACTEQALDRLKVSLQAAPGDSRILGMIARGENILVG